MENKSALNVVKKEHIEEIIEATIEILSKKGYLVLDTIEDETDDEEEK